LGERALNAPVTLAPSAFEAVAADYRRLLLRRLSIIALLFVALIASFAVDVASGPSGLSLGTLVAGIFDPSHLDRVTAAIIWNVRLPYALMALLVGASLSLCGAEMQAILDNPLASPFTLGVSSAAALGASLAIVFGFALPWLPANAAVTVCAFVCAFASVLLLQFMSRLRGAGVETIVLFGIALVFSCNAIVALLQLVATEDVLQQLIFWTLGSVARADWQKVGILALILALLAPFSFMAAPALTALRLGEDRARSFGVDVRRLRFLSLFRISLLSATAVASGRSASSASSGRTSRACLSAKTSAISCPPAPSPGRSCCRCHRSPASSLCPASSCRSASSRRWSVCQSSCCSCSNADGACERA
jgi:iron complex transport system permease protein